MTSAAPPDSAGREIDLQRLLTRAWQLFASAPVDYLFAGLALLLLSVLSAGILLGPLVVGFIRMADRHARGESISAGDIFRGMSSFGPAFVTALVVLVAIALASLLVVLPGVVIGFFTSYALYFVALKGQGTTGALSASFDLAKRHVGAVLLVLVIVIALNAVGSFVVVGALVTVPFSLILMTLSFNELTA